MQCRAAPTWWIEASSSAAATPATSGGFGAPSSFSIPSLSWLGCAVDGHKVVAGHGNVLGQLSRGFYSRSSAMAWSERLGMAKGCAEGCDRIEARAMGS